MRHDSTCPTTTISHSLRVEGAVHLACYHSRRKVDAGVRVFRFILAVFKFFLDRRRYQHYDTHVLVDRAPTRTPHSLPTFPYPITATYTWQIYSLACHDGCTS
jgi:hypothetical protein